MTSNAARYSTRNCAEGLSSFLLAVLSTATFAGKTERILTVFISCSGLFFRLKNKALDNTMLCFYRFMLSQGKEDRVLDNTVSL